MTALPAPFPQIHGEIRFQDHIQALVIHTSHKDNEAMIATLTQFSERYNIPLVWMAEDPAVAAARKAAAREAEAAEERRRLEEIARLVCHVCEERVSGGMTHCGYHSVWVVLSYAVIIV